MRRHRESGRSRRAKSLSCDVVRESISAALDGERPGIGAKESKAHLAQCQECQRFELGVTALTRQVSLQASRPASDALEELLATELARNIGPVPVASPHSWRISRSFRWRRSAQWIGALTPAVVVGVVLPLGALSSAHELPTHAPTPCTVHLRSHQS
jgi:RNA polymerase sigma-70 factor, ECF subfamily